MTTLSKSLLLGLCALTLGTLALSGGTEKRTKTAGDDAAQVEQQEPAIPAPEPADAETISGRQTPPTSEPTTIVHTAPTAEQVIRRAMQKQVDVKFVDTPLDEAMQFLADQGGYPLWINETALGEVGTPTDEPINETLEDVTIEQVLNWTLRPLGMTWVIEDEVLKVTTEIDAEERQYTKTYDIKKLIDLEFPQARDQDLNGDISVGKFRRRTYATRLLKNTETSPKRKQGSMVFAPGLRGGLVFQRQTSSQLSPATALFQVGGVGGITGSNSFRRSPDDYSDWPIDLIMQTTSGPWEENEGSGGTITLVNYVLVVRQTQKMHEEVVSLLQALEAVGDGLAKQGHIAALPETYPHKEDAAIRAVLANKSTVNYVDTPLSSVVDDIASRYKIRVRIDKTALDEEGITTVEPVTLKVKDISLRSTLNLILEPLGLTTYVSEGSLWITTEIAAEYRRFTVVYAATDLKEPDDEYMEGLIECIMRETSGPWVEDEGSGGVIAASESIGAIVIRQTAMVHREVAGLLANMRKTIAQQPKTKKPSEDPQEVITRVYNLQGMKIVDDLLTVIPRFVAPKTWGDDNDDSDIQKVGESLVIRQKRQVHKQIERFLKSFGYHRSLGASGC